MIARLRPLLLAAALLLLGASSALAANQKSTNWSGYAVSRGGVHFRAVSGRWRVPAVSCSSPGFSALWIGLGGFTNTSTALEQTGTEEDCSASGTASYFSWYEVVPAPSQTISLAVRPGNLMSGQVTVSGRRITFTLRNLTTHRSFSKTVSASPIDLTSAEWILESPSECDEQGRCMPLPLADFGNARFSNARTVTASHRSGSVLSRAWGETEISLSSAGFRFVAHGNPSELGGGSQPTALSAGGSAFALNYVPNSPTQGGTYFAPAARPLRGRRHLVHPARS